MHLDTQEDDKLQEYIFSCKKALKYNTFQL